MFSVYSKIVYTDSWIIKYIWHVRVFCFPTYRQNTYICNLCLQVMPPCISQIFLIKISGFFSRDSRLVFQTRRAQHILIFTIRNVLLPCILSILSPPPMKHYMWDNVKTTHLTHTDVPQSKQHRRNTIFMLLSGTPRKLRIPSFEFCGLLRC